VCFFASMSQRSRCEKGYLSYQRCARGAPENLCKEKVSDSAQDHSEPPPRVFSKDKKNRSMAFSWNIVTKNVSPNEARIPLEKKLRQKIAKFERHLKNFPVDAVHLQIMLERNAKKPIYTAILNLRIPSHILHSEHSAHDLVEAFDAAVKAMLRELESFKSNLRREKFWKRKERRQKLHELKATGFAIEPQPEGTGPQKYQDMVGELFRQHYKELLRHVRRHIRQDELAGDLAPNDLDPREVVEEVGRRALAQAAEGPKGTSWLLWLYHVIHRELKRRRRLMKQNNGGGVAHHRTERVSESSVRADQTGVSSELDKFVPRKDALLQLEQDMRSWPREEREVFELYFVEGLEPEEIAMVTQQALKSVQQNLASVQQRLRDQVMEQQAVL
jgi:RNA polymerase sigma factor (sigma-70 family)